MSSLTSSPMAKIEGCCSGMSMAMGMSLTGSGNSRQCMRVPVRLMSLTCPPSGPCKVMMLRRQETLTLPYSHAFLLAIISLDLLLDSSTLGPGSKINAPCRFHRRSGCQNPLKSLEIQIHPLPKRPGPRRSTESGSYQYPLVCLCL